MLRSVYKRKGSRVFRGKYRVGDNPRIFDVSLDTDKKHVAEERIRRIHLEAEEEAVGLRPSKSFGQESKDIPPLLEKYVADLVSRGRSNKHVNFSRNRLIRLCSDAGWKCLSDVNPDSFHSWRNKQKLAPKTLNHYQGHATAFLNWIVDSGHLPANPLKTVGKVDTRGKETSLRRAYSLEELQRLVNAAPVYRAILYLTAAYTGLRRNELKSLRWTDVNLKSIPPTVTTRAAASKNRKEAVLPLAPHVAAALRQLRRKFDRDSARVFFKGIAKVPTLRMDMKSAKVPVEDARGAIADFHSFRVTFATLLAISGVGPRVAMELMRHSDINLTNKTYTDASALPLSGAVGQLPFPKLHHTAHQKGVQTCPKQGKREQNGELPISMSNSVSDSLLAIKESEKVAEREGFEPSVPF